MNIDWKAAKDAFAAMLLMIVVAVAIGVVLAIPGALAIMAINAVFPAVASPMGLVNAWAMTFIMILMYVIF